MNQYVKIGLFGFLIWLVPFVVAFFVFPLQTSNPEFFNTIMSVSLVTGTVYFSVRYLREVNQDYLNKSMIAGIIWLLINIAIDLPFFVFGILSKLSFGSYLAEIGLGYLVIPMIVIGFGSLLQAKK